MSRFGGLRCPSEHLSLRWRHVNWKEHKIKVESPKTEHHEGGESRVVPIFPELRAYLEDAFKLAKEEAAAAGGPLSLDAYVITRYRDTNQNLRTQLGRYVEKAGLEPWPKLFQNLRATRATELVNDGWPEYKVCKWLGHTEKVAKNHYWQVTDDDYRRAAGAQSDSTSTACTATPKASGNTISAPPVSGMGADSSGSVEAGKKILFEGDALQKACKEPSKQTWGHPK